AQGFGNFPQKAKEHLAKAAAAYGESGAEMAALARQFEAFGTLDDYPARVQTMGRALSSVESRRKAIDILRSIRSAETNAIAEIEKALAAMDALAFLDAHKGLFQGWNDERRQAIAEKLLAMAEQFKGTDIGARALMMAAEAHAGACEHTRPVGRDGWDRTIALYQRVADEYPGTQQAHEAQWQIAGCHGCWARSDCCEFNRGKEDWPTAIKLYQQLYETDEHPGCKCDALRRIAEIQCNFTGEWQEGLATYSRMLREFPEDPPGPHRSWTNRTCGPLNGTFLIEHDLVDFSFPSLMGRADTPEEAARIREEFVRLGPDNDGIRFHTLHYLEGALRRLGNDKQADEIKKQVGLCETWAVVGPFNGTNGAAEQTVEEIPDAFNRSRHLSEAIRTQMQTSYAPEKDKPAGGADVSAEYDVTAADGRRGKGMWIGASGTMLLNTWEIPGAFYAFAEVNSPAQQAGQLRVAISGFARAWLNGRHVLDTNIVDYPVLDQNIAPVQLKAGRNHLLMKFVPWDRAYGSFVRITDEQGVALPDVTYSTPDVPAENVRKSDFLRQ
ncbi:MAG: tetratricopeptide repeat protein, partial [Planctomycetes bacterium]|nr:tetratricopeptide repeat protein [Planctomycetota bacterium]